MHIVQMNNLAAIRSLRNLSQEQLGEMIGMNQSTIQRAEQGADSAKLRTYKLCAERLNVTLGQIFADNLEPLRKELVELVVSIPLEDLGKVDRVINAVLSSDPEGEE